jgi:hypothetical protein
MNRTCYGLTTVLLFPRIRSLRINLWMKLIFLSYLSILPLPLVRTRRWPTAAKHAHHVAAACRHRRPFGALQPLRAPPQITAPALYLHSTPLLARSLPLFFGEPSGRNRSPPLAIASSVVFRRRQATAVRLPAHSASPPSPLLRTCISDSLLA